MAIVRVLGVSVLAAGIVPAAFAQGDFQWQGRVAAGRTVEVKGVNGDVQALASTSGRVEVSAVKRARRSDPADVKIEVLEHEGGVTICAVYPTPPRARRDNACTTGDEWHSSVEQNDVEVDFTVRVPPAVHFTGRTVNGEVEAEGLGGNVQAYTVNGSIRASTAGWVEAATVNGSITARLGKADWANELEFHTVNGGITLDLPADLAAAVRAETVNGDFESDYPLTVTGRFGPRRVSGTIGGGGRYLHLKTVNGSIRLRKGA